MLLEFLDIVLPSGLCVAVGDNPRDHLGLGGQRQEFLISLEQAGSFKEQIKTNLITLPLKHDIKLILLELFLVIWLPLDRPFQRGRREERLVLGLDPSIGSADVAVEAVGHRQVEEVCKETKTIEYIVEL